MPITHTSQALVLLLACLLHAAGLTSCSRLEEGATLRSRWPWQRQPLLSDKSFVVDGISSCKPTALPSRVVNPDDAARDTPGLASVFTASGAAGRRAAGAGVPQLGSRPVAFPDKDGGLDLGRAKLLAQLQSVSYCTNASDIQAWNCTRCLKLPGFTTQLAHFDASWDLLAFAGYSAPLGAKLLAFRGTDSSSWYNWAENMRAWRTDATYPQPPGAPRSPAMRIHSGFWVLWNGSSLAATFTAAFADLHAAHPLAPTYVIGHSMGGALAHLAALDLKFKFGLQDVRVYTFGAPRVGNAAFADFFESQVTESYRFTHGRDIVPSVPLQVMGFHHVSREVWLVDVDAGGGGDSGGGDGGGDSGGGDSGDSGGGRGGDGSGGSGGNGSHPHHWWWPWSLSLWPSSWGHRSAAAGADVAEALHPRQRVLTRSALGGEVGVPSGSSARPARAEVAAGAGGGSLGGGGGGGSPLGSYPRDDVDERLIVCDDSGEDSSCHNSVCHLGLCTSVADHLLYLGAHMYRADEC